MALIAGLIDAVIVNHENQAELEAIGHKVNEMMSDRPLFTW